MRFTGILAQIPLVETVTVQRSWTSDGHPHIQIVSIPEDLSLDELLSVLRDAIIATEQVQQQQQIAQMEQAATDMLSQNESEPCEQETSLESSSSQQ